MSADIVRANVPMEDDWPYSRVCGIAGDPMSQAEQRMLRRYRTPGAIAAGRGTVRRRQAPPGAALIQARLNSSTVAARAAVWQMRLAAVAEGHNLACERSAICRHHEKIRSTISAPVAIMGRSSRR